MNNEPRSHVEPAQLRRLVLLFASAFLALALMVADGIHILVGKINFLCFQEARADDGGDGDGDGDGDEALLLLFSSQSPAQQGLVRVINHSDEEGEVHVHAIDDSGEHHGPVTLPLGAKAAIHFNSRDLEQGNDQKGMSGGMGDGEGAWRLRFDTDLDIAAFAYARQSAFVGLHDVAPEIWPGQWYVPTFNPGSNMGRLSLLRLINPNDADAEVLIDGLDALGDPPLDGPIVPHHRGFDEGIPAAKLRRGFGSDSRWQRPTL